MVDVTVIIPTHNRLHLLAAAISAILRQDGFSVETVVADDDSTDGTGLWLDRIAAEESRIESDLLQPVREANERNQLDCRAFGETTGMDHCTDDRHCAP